jgi:hypothetical protein
MADFNVPVSPAYTILGGDGGLVSGGGGVNTSSPAVQLKYYQDWKRGQETQARLYVSLPQSAKAALKASARKTAGGSRADTLIDTLCGDNGYIDFILSSAQESSDERVQPVELLGDDYVAYFFGSRIPTYAFSGTLFTTLQDDWWDAFSILYKEIMRGTKLAQYQALVHLSYDSRVISGAMLNFSTSLQADTQMAVSFNFQLLVKQVSFVRPRRGGSASFDPTQTKKVFGGTDFNKDVFTQRLAVDNVAVNITTAQVTDTRQATAPTDKPATPAATTEEQPAAVLTAKAVAEEAARVDKIAALLLDKVNKRYKDAKFGSYIAYEGAPHDAVADGNPLHAQPWYTPDQESVKIVAYNKLPDGSPDYSHPLLKSDGTVDYASHGQIITYQEAQQQIRDWIEANNPNTPVGGKDRKLPTTLDLYEETPKEKQARMEKEKMYGMHYKAIGGGIKR